MKLSDAYVAAVEAGEEHEFVSMLAREGKVRSTHYEIVEGPASVQGSEPWRNFRYENVGASEIPALLGIEEAHDTYLTVFETKFYRQEQEFDRYKQRAFAAGHAAEENARAWLRKQGIDAQPMVVKSLRVPGLIASLDAFSPEAGTGCEMKYVSREAFERVEKTGELPPHHYFQVQAQLLATGARSWTYFPMNEAEGLSVDVLPDEEAFARIAKVVPAFLADLKAGKFPEPGPRDWVTPADSRFEALAKLKRGIEDLTEQFDALKAELATDYSDLRRIRAGGLTMVRSVSAGSVNWKKAIAELGVAVDENKYRGKPVERVTVAFERKKEKEV